MSAAAIAAIRGSPGGTPTGATEGGGEADAVVVGVTDPPPATGAPARARPRR